MALKNQVANVYGVGLRNVASYQVSGHPYLTGSTIDRSVTYNVSGVAGEQKISFPYITQTITVVNTTGAGNLYCMFVSSSSPGWNLTKKQFITVNAGESMTFDVKCKEIFLHNDHGTNQTFELIADLTNIPTERMYPLTGSGVTE